MFIVSLVVLAAFVTFVFCCHPSPLEILTITCLTFCLLLTDRPALGLPEYKFKVVNIGKMHGTGGLEVVVLCTFGRFQRKIEIVRKGDEKVL